MSATKRTYTTSQGQCWDEIARALWGREALMHHLMAANPVHRGVVVFVADVVLAVPDVAITPNEEPPPWQQR